MAGRADGTAAGARGFGAIESDLRDLSEESSQAAWIAATYLTRDTEAVASKSYARLLSAGARYAKEVAGWPAEGMDAVDRRKATLLRLFPPLAAPNDAKDAQRLTRTITEMESMYARGKYRPRGATLPLSLEALSRTLATSRDPAEMLDVWSGWHDIAPPMRPRFQEYVELANRGARDGGFADLGAMWRAKYEMPPEEFSREVDRLWAQVEPLYRKLHEYARRRLRAVYGDEIVPANGPLPVHLLGNMWAQSWEHVYPLLAPPGEDPGIDLTTALRAKGIDDVGLVRIAERFFTSLGLDPLPASFWERSMFRRPADREVECHASAWDIDNDEDLRIKMCIDVTGEEFHVIHHELGHNYYQRAYRHQPFLFQDGAHDGFHEAVGDTISLSITPEYLRTLGLIETVPDPSKDLGLLLHRALEKVVFLPFGLLIDQWRWRVFSGEIGPDRYNASWWELRERYQGIRPPTERPETYFDPGAKAHVASNVPYMRYFLAHLLQFQFHRGLARAAGYDGPLHRFSIYGSREAGRRLATMLEMGQSRPWPDALEAVTGERRMDGAALLEYFRPLSEWLDRAGR